MPTTTQIETYLSSLGITKMVVSTTDFDDEFSAFIYQILVGARNNIVTHNGEVVVHNGNVVTTSA